jgi:phenylpropionate dioxygenase-like ring-hydroxylating dioxygenase large terminal subunit
LPTATGQGLLFVWSGTASAADSAALPLVPVLQEQGDGWADGWIVQDTFRDLPMDALTLLENVLDVSHVPFTHHRTVGKRENASPVEAVITREDSQGFEAFWQEGPRRGKLGSQDTHFRAPQLMWHDLTAKGFARILTVVYAVPISRGKCRLFARFPFQFKAAAPRLLVGLRPRWLQHIGNHKVLEDDQVFLHWQERVLENAGGSAAAEQAFVLPTSSDVYVKALHRWVNHQGGGPFAGRPLPPRQDVEALMDRYHSHTKHCRSCSGALASYSHATALALGIAVVVCCVDRSRSVELAALVGCGSCWFQRFFAPTNITLAAWIACWGWSGAPKSASLRRLLKYHDDQRHIALSREHDPGAWVA